ncbi:uncharacterized protein LOC109793752 [Cajanus cajan]|uniref:uncharacterized protein LOC109793752 n=1 Tax=Cajanus cajan TaxID=3821 RepID=UPI0010FBA161|nr:uncharacterized protein LOC109793752 [Cajanus cajan]
MPTTRGRGRRVNQANNPHQLTQIASNPPPHVSHHSPRDGSTSSLANGGATSASGGQSSDTTPLINGGESNTIPTSDNQQPTMVPSSEDSNVEVDRRQIISVEAVSKPKRFAQQFVTRDIISEVMSRMPYAADCWKSYCPEMKEMLFNDFKVSN